MAKALGITEKKEETPLWIKVCMEHLKQAHGNSFPFNRYCGGEDCPDCPFIPAAALKEK
jgi:hypothetical protein